MRSPARRLIHVSSLGRNGRFGNQLFHYCFAKAYAQKHKAVLQVPADWIGRQVFKIPEPPVQGELPLTEMDEIPAGRVNVDLLGWYQFKGALDHYSRARAREWLVIQDRWRARFAKKPRPWYAAAHLRRGDLASHADRWAIVGRASYERAIAAAGIRPDDVIWLSEETQAPDPELDALGLGLLPDFFTMLHADVLFRANSSFSYWPAVLGDARVFAPLVEDRVGAVEVEFAEGNWPRFIDMKNNPGLCHHTDLDLKER